MMYKWIMIATLTLDHSGKIPTLVSMEDIYVKNTDVMLYQCVDKRYRIRSTDMSHIYYSTINVKARKGFADYTTYDVDLSCDRLMEKVNK